MKFWLMEFIPILKMIATDGLPKSLATNSTTNSFTIQNPKSKIQNGIIFTHNNNRQKLRWINISNFWRFIKYAIVRGN
ncbi:hypothetical protein JYQ62_01070 [Nostoc sp. UHCC 0702]|nr:hypothetical protein JYQ62_01070 [Nostoc sp. UHCC 0702]